MEKTSYHLTNYIATCLPSIQMGIACWFQEQYVGIHATEAFPRKTPATVANTVYNVAEKFC